MTAQLAKAHEYFKGGKFSNVVTTCQGVLQALPLVVVETRQQQPEVTELFASAREYALAAQLFVAQKAETDPLRKAEVAALMTHCKLKPPHLALALKNAMVCLTKPEIGCYQHGGAVARRLLELNPPPKMAQDAKKVRAPAPTPLRRCPLPLRHRPLPCGTARPLLPTRQPAAAHRGAGLS
jgi:hypothetical protein